MARRRLILGSMICLSIAVFAGESLCQVWRYRRRNPLQDLNRRRAAEQRQMQREHENRRRDFEKRAAERKERRQQEQQEEPKQVRREARVRRDASIREVLEATAEQWKVIEPKFKKVQALLRESRISIAPISYSAGGSSGGDSGSYRRVGGATGSAGAGGGGGAGGGRIPSDTVSEEARSWNESGWKWLRPSIDKGPGRLTKGERTCEELLDLVEDEGASPEAIRQKLRALRNIREDAARQLAKARQELREPLTRRQEATLVLMGWLD